MKKLKPYDRDGQDWTSKALMKSSQKSQQQAPPPKISSVRYAALKKIELVPEKQLKQSTLSNFLVKNKTVLAKTRTSERYCFPMINEQNTSAMNQIPCVSSRNFKNQPRSLLPYNNVVSNTHSPQRIHCGKENCCETVAQYKKIKFLIMPEAANTAIISNDKDKSNLTGNAVTKPVDVELCGSRVYLPDKISGDKEIFLQEKKQVSPVKSKNYEPTINSTCNSNLDLIAGNEYDLTMKFVPDSQGNMIFDHFTQKYKSEDKDVLNSFTDSEKEMYAEFENSLLQKNYFQSTQYQS